MKETERKGETEKWRERERDREIERDRERIEKYNCKCVRCIRRYRFSLKKIVLILALVVLAEQQPVGR